MEAILCQECEFWKRILDASWTSGFKSLTTDDGECTNEDIPIWDIDGEGISEGKQCFTSKDFGCNFGRKK